MLPRLISLVRSEHVTKLPPSACATALRAGLRRAHRSDDGAYNSLVTRWGAFVSLSELALLLGSAGDLRVRHRVLRLVRAH